MHSEAAAQVAAVPPASSQAAEHCASPVQGARKGGSNRPMSPRSPSYAPPWARRAPSPQPRTPPRRAGPRRVRFGIGIDEGPESARASGVEAESLRTSVNEAASPPASRLARSNEASAAIAPSARGDETSQLQGPHRDLANSAEPLGIEASFGDRGIGRRLAPARREQGRERHQRGAPGRRKTGLIRIQGQSRAESSRKNSW